MPPAALRPALASLFASAFESVIESLIDQSSAQSHAPQSSSHAWAAESHAAPAESRISPMLLPAAARRTRSPGTANLQTQPALPACPSEAAARWYLQPTELPQPAAMPTRRQGAASPAAPRLLGFRVFRASPFPWLPMIDEASAPCTSPPAYSFLLFIALCSMILRVGGAASNRLRIPRPPALMRGMNG